MNKQLVDAMLPDAVEILKDTGIVNKDDEIDMNFRSQISSFGAAVSTGSLLAATAFFNQQKKAKTDRGKLMEALNELLKRHGWDKYAKDTTALFDTILKVSKESDSKDMLRKLKDDILSAAIALKLSMNLYKPLNDDKEKSDIKQGVRD